MITRKDALLNSGLPHLADKYEMLRGNIYDFSNSDIQEISNQIKAFDKYYISGWKDSTTRAIVKTIVNEYCDIFRCNRYLIKD